MPIAAQSYPDPAGLPGRRRKPAGPAPQPLQRFQQLQLALHVRAASANLFDRWLVVGWCATDRRAEVCVHQLQPVVSRNAGGLRSKAGGKENLVEKISRAVAGEHSPGAIGAVGSRGQADQKQPGAWDRQSQELVSPNNSNRDRRGVLRAPLRRDIPPGAGIVRTHIWLSRISRAFKLQG